MRRAFILATTIATLIALITVSVAAAGWGGGFGASNLTFVGTYSGSGSKDATFTFQGFGTGTCTNPGDNVNPGHSGQVAVSANFTSVQIDQYGRITFSGVVLSSDACPNAAWLSDIIWTRGVATATYPKGGKLFADTATFTCGPRDANGHQFCPEDK
jgi:hypothetical protein